MEQRVHGVAAEAVCGVAQTSESAVSQVSKPVRAWMHRTVGGSPASADLEVGDTADLEICATGRQ